MRLVPLFAVVMAVSGCTAANDAADAIARDRAKGVVNGVVQDRFPGVNAAPVTDCIIDAASAREILSIAGASVSGVTEETARDVIAIAQRPEAVECIARNSLVLMGN